VSGKLFIVSAPSGAGKTTLVDEMLKRLQPAYPIDRLVTYTSRSARKGEAEGVDFFFVSPQEFERRVQQGFFLEWSKEYHHYYGSPKSIIDDLKIGQSRILVIDKNGANQVLQHISDAITIWITVPSTQVLKERLEKRRLNTPEQVKKRLEIAKLELEQEAKNRFYMHHVANNVFEKAADTLEKLFILELAK